jgi:GNAT superfamily N-acetyltransferase
MEHTVSDTFILRLATLDDIPTLVRHRRGMFVDMDALKGGTLDPHGLDAMDVTYASYARACLIDGRMQAWIIADGDQPAASGAILYTDWLPRPDGKQSVLAYVHSVYTEPDYRRRGLARRILVAIMAECRARGLPRLSLHASDQGRGLYEQLGFVPTNEMRLVLG